MIINNLKALILEKKTNISRLSEITGISRTAITALANGNANGIQYDTLDKLCYALKVKPSQILVYIPFNISTSIDYCNVSEHKLTAECTISFISAYSTFEFYTFIDCDDLRTEGTYISMEIESELMYQKHISQLTDIELKVLLMELCNSICARLYSSIDDELIEQYDYAISIEFYNEFYKWGLLDAITYIEDKRRQ